jgi:hypothetical protein
MDLSSFTVEQENLLCIYDTSTRTACIAEIADALPHFDDPDMREIAESTLATLHGMTDGDFAALIINPAYFNGEEEV